MWRETVPHLASHVVLKHEYGHVFNSIQFNSIVFIIAPKQYNVWGSTVWKNMSTGFVTWIFHSWPKKSEKNTFFPTKSVLWCMFCSTLCSNGGELWAVGAQSDDSSTSQIILSKIWPLKRLWWKRLLLSTHHSDSSTYKQPVRQKSDLHSTPRWFTDSDRTHINLSHPGDIFTQQQHDQ